MVFNPRRLSGQSPAAGAGKRRHIRIAPHRLIGDSAGIFSSAGCSTGACLRPPDKYCSACVSKRQHLAGRSKVKFSVGSRRALRFQPGSGNIRQRGFGPSLPARHRRTCRLGRLRRRSGIGGGAAPGWPAPWHRQADRARLPVPRRCPRLCWPAAGAAPDRGCRSAVRRSARAMRQASEVAKKAIARMPSRASARWPRRAPS